MNETQPGTPPWGATPESPRLGDELRTLRRSRSDRVVAGVLGGVGRRLGIDPVVLRVVTAVLAVFGGVGILFYAIAWLLIPADDEPGSVLDQALGRHDRTPGSVPLAIFLTIMALISSGNIVGGSWDGGVLMILAAIGFVALLRRRDSESAARAQAAAGWSDPAAYVPPYAGDATGTAYPADSASPAATADTDLTSAMPAPGTESTGWPEGPDWVDPRAEWHPYPEPAPAPAASAKPRSTLGPITVSAAIISVGILAINDATWAAVPEAMYLAVPLGIVAIGLLVGAWLGRSRGLIALGILLSVALVPTAFLSQLDTTAVDESVHIDTVADIPTDTVSYGAGSITYDLSDLVLTDSDNVQLAIEQGAGELNVIVPPNADVIVNGSTGAGEISAFGQTSGGIGRERRITDNGADGPGGGTIELDLQLGLGEIAVTR